MAPSHKFLRAKWNFVCARSVFNYPISVKVV